MKVEQFVMAYGVEQDRIRAMLPDGFVSLRPVLRTNTEIRQFDDCEFAWTFSERDAHGVSIGKTLPAFEEEQKTRYEKQDFTPENAAAIPCRQVLGSYIVKFERTERK